MITEIDSLKCLGQYPYAKQALASRSGELAQGYDLLRFTAPSIRLFVTPGERRRIPGEQEKTPSRPIREVKLDWAHLVLG